jgi:hypothetical protein
MAETNWNLLDTTIPARIAAIPQEAEKAQTANMLQAMQMQGLMNQNELAQSQLRTTKRAEEAQNLLGKAYAGLDFSGAGGAGAPAGQSPYAAMKAQVVKSLAGTGRADLIPSELAKIDEMQHKATVNQEVAGKVEKQARDVVDYTWKQYQSEVPKVTDAAGVERWTRAAYKDPLLGPIVSKFKPEEQAVSDALNLINQPGGLNRWIAKHMGMSADKMIDMLKTTTRTTNLNDVSRAQTEDFFGDPVGPAVDTPMGVSPNTTETINATRKNHLENLAQQGWTFDTDRGIAVNARQGISRPISTLMAPVGGGFSAAPAVGGAPAPSIAAPGGGVPGQRQAPAGQPAAGVLGPKPEKLNESQGNATAFGLRMKESNAILERLAKEGVLRGANVESTPFVGGAAGKVLPSALGGTSEQQQQVNQAKSNFITAVLRKESGAVINDSEFEREDNKYFPQLNDGPKVIKQKENARKLAIEAMKFQAGPGAKEIDRYVPSVSSDLSMPPPGAVRPRRN